MQITSSVSISVTAGIQMQSPPPILELNNVEVIYDSVSLAIKGVSLEVPQGGMVALLGANGAGKSTTLKSISGLLRPERGKVSRGEVRFMGQTSTRWLPKSASNSASCMYSKGGAYSNISRPMKTSSRLRPCAATARTCCAIRIWCTHTSSAFISVARLNRAICRAANNNARDRPRFDDPTQTADARRAPASDWLRFLSRKFLKSCNASTNKRGFRYCSSNKMPWPPSKWFHTAI